MYPSEVRFQPVETGPALLSWQAVDGAAGWIIYRSSVAIGPEDTERFYQGAFGHSMSRLRLDSAARALVDDRVETATWYLVQGVDRSGNLLAVDFEAATLDRPEAVPEDARHARERRHGHVYADPPEMVFREDDHSARLQIRAMAAALSRDE